MKTPLDIHPKAAAASGAGLGAIAVVWILALLGVHIDTEAAAGIVWALASVAAYLAPVVNAERARIVDAPLIVSSATTAAGTEIHVTTPTPPPTPQPGGPPPKPADAARSVTKPRRPSKAKPKP